MVIEQGTKQTEISALLQLTFQRRVGSEDNHGMWRVTHITEKNNTDKEDRDGWRGVGDASFYTEPSGDGILRKEGNPGVWLLEMTEVSQSKWHNWHNHFSSDDLTVVILAKLWKLGWGSKTQGHAGSVQKSKYLPTLPELMWRLLGRYRHFWMVWKHSIIKYLNG